ncbi:MAG: hypothetical protein Q8M02_05755 [Candidatus Didemnitutus sp.]|nr:hypothetical protein [Candidatus Didemnitutus sp.]
MKNSKRIEERSNRSINYEILVSPWLHKYIDSREFLTKIKARNITLEVELCVMLMGYIEDPDRDHAYAVFKNVNISRLEADELMSQFESELQKHGVDIAKMLAKSTQRWAKSNIFEWANFTINRILESIVVDISICSQQFDDRVLERVIIVLLNNLADHKDKEAKLTLEILGLSGDLDALIENFRDHWSRYMSKVADSRMTPSERISKAQIDGLRGAFLKLHMKDADQ